MLTPKIDNWLTTSIKEVEKTHLAKDIHIDELIDVQELSSEEIISKSIVLFNDFVQCFRDKEWVEELVLYLSIDLMEYNSVLKGAPLNFKALCADYDHYSMPEVILYKPVPSIYPPNAEIYRKPLAFDEFSTYRDLIFFYKEARVLGNVDFERALNVVYVPN